MTEIFVSYFQTGITVKENYFITEKTQLALSSLCEWKGKMQNSYLSQSTDKSRARSNFFPSRLFSVDEKEEENCLKKFDSRLLRLLI
jgi:hypothetical protein